MKRLSMIMVCVLAMMAACLSAKAQEVTITLYPGNTWISYPRSEMLDINTALGDFVPAEGDIIKSQFTSSTYRNGYWRGGVTHFMPGWGYMYYSNRTEVVSFVFGEAAPQLTVTTAEPTDISNTSANCGGSIASYDGSYIYVLEKGVCWAVHPNPTAMNDFHTENGGGPDSFIASMTELTPNTMYYVRAYAVTESGTFYGEEYTFVTLEIPAGAINGLFSVSNSKQVYFSQGNLQYIGSSSKPYWKFAENQWDYLGTSTGQNSSYQDVDRDLFGWGTSGWNNGNVYFQPYDYEYFGSGWNIGLGYGPTDGSYYCYNLTGIYADADWGVYNPISNGGNQPNQWRTLTNEEWLYVFYFRSTVSGIRYAKAQVNNVNGVILLPDDWDVTYFTLYNTDLEYASFNSNIINNTQWNVMEQHGAVFLPAAGYRDGTSVNDVCSHGCYWSTSYYTSSHSFGLCITDFSLIPDSQCHPYRYYGRSVRLVHVQ